MTRETRIGLLVGLAFIVMFGVVLSDLTGDSSRSQKPFAPQQNSLRLVPESDYTIPSMPPRAPGELAAVVEMPQEPVASAVVDETLPPIVEAVTPAVAVVEQETPAVPEVAPVVEMPTVAVVQPAADSQATVAQGEPVKPKTYKIETKDTLIAIARKMYGPGNEMQYKLIAGANKDTLKNEASLKVGQVIVIPDLPQPVADKSAPVAGIAEKPGYQEVDVKDLSKYLTKTDAAAAKVASPAKAVASKNAKSSRTYMVRKGDRLSSIARTCMNDGSKSAITRLYNANKDKLGSPDRLPVGVQLKIPG